MERNLLAKRFPKGILYSKENIKITLFYSENSKKLKNSPDKKTPALLSQGSPKFLEKDNKNSEEIKEKIKAIVKKRIEKQIALLSFKKIQSDMDYFLQVEIFKATNVESIFEGLSNILGRKRRDY